MSAGACAILQPDHLHLQPHSVLLELLNLGFALGQLACQVVLQDTVNQITAAEWHCHSDRQMRMACFAKNQRSTEAKMRCMLGNQTPGDREQLQAGEVCCTCSAVLDTTFGG